MTAHTPGPWQYNDQPNDRCCWSFGVETVAREAGSDDPLAGIADVAEEADARLIAAAPDLLAALRAIVAYMRENGDPCQECGLNQDTPAWVQALEAIDSAEGR